MIQPLLSVCLITYNHVKYIEQAIEGVLMQQTNFPFELIIADDFSTDGTREIVVNYQKKYSALIRLILQPKNVGAAQNWSELITTPSAKYIAYFEGDDYWTNTNKLQKQVDFLEVNEDYAICFHESVALKDDGYQFLMVNLDENKIFEFSDLTQRNFIPTASCVFRVFESAPFLEERFKKISAGDWLLHLINAQYGKIYYLKDCMSVYRLHGQGIWSSMDRETMVKKTIHLMDELNEFFDYKYHIDFEKGQQLLLEEYKREIVLQTPPQLSLMKRVKRKFKRIFNAD